MTEAQSTNTSQNPVPQFTTFLRPNADFNSSQKLTNVPLNGQNYIPWAKAAKITLKGKGLLGYVNGNRKKPTEGVEAQDEWDMIDSQVITLISNSLDPKLAETFYCETAAELWQAIENQFSNKNSHSQIYHIKKEITQITQESKSIPELVGHVRAKYEELKLYRPPTTDLTVLQEREETDRVYTFLAALDTSYEAIRAQLLLSSDKLTFNDVTARIQNEATRRLAMNPSTDLNAAENKACAARNPNTNLRDESRPRGAPNSDEKCDHCKKLGHNRDACWFLHPHLRPNRGKEEKGSSAHRGGMRQGGR